jgi:hypothetical protein
MHLKPLSVLSLRKRTHLACGDGQSPANLEPNNPQLMRLVPQTLSSVTDAGSPAIKRAGDQGPTAAVKPATSAATQRQFAGRRTQISNLIGPALVRAAEAKSVGLRSVWMRWQLKLKS